MGLNQSENAGMIYLGVGSGKLVREVKEPTKDSATRVNKVGRSVHEVFYKDLTGVITRIESKENKFGKQFQIVFTDGGDKYMVQMQYSGRYTSSFLKALPNVPQGEPVRFMPWEMADKNDAAKKVTGVTLYLTDEDGQFKTKVLPAYTKEEPNGLPEMKQVKIKGKITWDDHDMMTFLEAMAKDWCNSAPAVTDEQASKEDAPF